MITNCAHVAGLSGLSAPKLSQAVHREECTQCFDNQVKYKGLGGANATLIFDNRIVSWALMSV